MRLKQIKIINFGQFSNKTFDLPSDQINVFFGANEAGKSTTVAFIKQIIFGFHLRSNSSPFFEDYAPLARVSPMGGSLLFEDNGSEYELERLYAKGDKTKKGILTVKKDGQVVPESLFLDQIQNIDGIFYADSFIFNQEMLGQVNSLSQEKLLERIYYLGASNSSQLLELRDKFAKQASDLFKKTGKRPEVNRLLKQIEEQRQELADTEAEFTDYQKLDQELAEQNTQLAQKQAALSKLQKELQGLQELQKELQNYQALLKLQTQVKDIKFDSQNYQKAQDIAAQCRNLENTIESLQRQLEQFDQQPADLTADKKLVQQKSQLLQWQSEYRNCMQKAEQLKQEKKQLINLTPEIVPLLNANTEQIKNLKSDYEALPKETDKPVQASENKIGLIAGGVLAVIGLILLVLGSVVIGIVALIASIALLAFAYRKNNVAHQAVEKQKEQQAQRKNFEEKYGLKPDNLNLNNVLINLSQYQLKENSVQSNEQELAGIDQNLQKLASQLQAALHEPISDDFDEILTGIDKLEDKIDQAQEREQQKRSLSVSLSQDQQNLKELKLNLQTVFASTGVKDMAAYDATYQDYLQQTKLQTQIETLKESLNGDLEKLQQITEKPDELAQKMQTLNEQIDQASDEVNTLRQNSAQIQVELANLADSNAVFAAKQKLTNTETEFTNSSKEYLANLLAAQWISRALDLASNERFPKMLKSAKEYLKLLTGGRYTDIDLAKKLSVVNSQGKKKEVKYLSRGTAEQLYFALKLAFVEQIKDKINLPILIDDSFVNFDDRRVKYIKELLEKISQNNQVLIFTAQENLVERIGLKPLTFTKGT